VKVGIVVPFSWSYWGGVVEHAENQARALIDLGHDARIIIGNDPPGRLTHTLHPREGRHGALPDFVIPVGRTVIIPANGSLSNICLTPQAMRRMKRAFAREQFDVLHVHEPLAPILSLYALAAKPCPIVVTAHSSGGRWYAWGRRFWHVLAPRIDYRIAVSEQARRASEPNIGGPFEIVPNGVALSPAPRLDGRDHHVVFVGRHEQRKGLPVLLHAWPEVHRRTGARLRLMGADPLAVRLLLRRAGAKTDGIDILGVVTAETRTAELLRAKVLASPAVGGESFGLVLAEAFATATPVVASDIAGYREVASEEAGVLVPPGDTDALVQALVDLLENEDRRLTLGARAREIAEARFSWTSIATRLLDIYESVAGVEGRQKVALA
jgi:phosphatidylinositol alpha-mannosyltransferase